MFLSVFLLSLGVGAAIVMASRNTKEPQIIPDDQAMATSLATGVPLQDQIPSLSSDEKARVREIVLNDSRLAAVRGESSMVVDEAAIWQSGYAKLGGGAHIHFDPPITWEGEWQFVVFPSVDSGLTPTGEGATFYRLDSHRMRVEDMSEARVLVDLKNGSVLTIIPVSRSEFFTLETPDPLWTPQGYR
jgi:hypothetical protein